MKRIKKLITVFIAVILSLTCIIFAGCDFTFKFDGCAGGQLTDQERLPEDTQTIVSEYTLELEELENTFYLPRVKGYIVRESVPTSIAAVCKGAETTLEIKTLSFENGKYKMSFDQNINCFREIAKDETVEVTILIYTADETTTLKEKASFVSNDDYEPHNCIDMETGIQGAYLDKKSNWTKPL